MAKQTKQNHSSAPAVPNPLFDTLDNMLDKHTDSPMPEALARLPAFKDEYELAKAFLLSYTGSQDTFNAYRREVERLCQWAWWVADTPLAEMNRESIIAYMDFIQNPPASWVGQKHCARFLTRDGVRVTNPEWRPFVHRAKKAEVKAGIQTLSKQHQLTPKSMQAVFVALSSFYQFLIAETYVDVNPLSLIRQKSKYIQKRQGSKQVRRLSETQWKTVIECIRSQCEVDPNAERSYFMMQCFFLLGLRISELADTDNHCPVMGDFAPDKQSRWWFTTIGKGNKERDIAVPDSMLEGLKRYRQWLGLSPLPSRQEQTPLLGKLRGTGGLTVRQVRHLVQACFDHAIYKLREQNQLDEANDLAHATVHWLRHTAISVDITTRPREHVRDDAGHGNAATTEQYIDTKRGERHASAKHKALLPNESPDT